MGISTVNERLICTDQLQQIISIVLNTNVLYGIRIKYYCKNNVKTNVESKKIY